MKKVSSKDTLRSEYKRSDFPAGFVRGKYAARAAAASNIVVLEPDLATAFPNSAAVNDALRAILQAAKHVAVERSGTYIAKKSDALHPRFTARVYG